MVLGEHAGLAGMVGDEEDNGAGFGVRRPLRFLAYKLELDEQQVAELAKILDELKTERAQASVDDRRSLADFAEAFRVRCLTRLEPMVPEIGEWRQAARLRDSVAKALSRSMRF